MTVYLVGAGPGAGDLLTIRARNVLEQADIIFTDRLARPVLDGLTLKGEVIDVGKIAHSPDSTSQEEIFELLISASRTHSRVVRLKGGDPFVFGRAREEIDALEAHSIAWEVVPGLSSALVAPAVAAIPLTHRGLATGFVVVTGHDLDDDAPPWAALGPSITVVVLMAMARRDRLAEVLVAGGHVESEPVAIIERATTPDERVTMMTISTMADAELEAPAVIVIGDVVKLASNDHVDPSASR